MIQNDFGEAGALVPVPAAGSMASFLQSPTLRAVVLGVITGTLVWATTRFIAKPPAPVCRCTIRRSKTRRSRR